MPPTPDAARAIADAALVHIANDAELVAALLAATGASPQDLRAMAGSDGLALSCLDLLLESDARVLDFAAAEGLRPETVAQARAVLTGPVWD